MNFKLNQEFCSTFTDEWHRIENKLEHLVSLVKAVLIYFQTIELVNHTVKFLKYDNLPFAIYNSCELIIYDVRMVWVVKQ